MRASTAKALTSHARFVEERRRERVSVGSRLLAHASGRKDVEVRVKGVLGKVNSVKEGLLLRKDRKINAGKEGLLQASRVGLLRD